MVELLGSSLARRCASVMLALVERWSGQNEVYCPEILLHIARALLMPWNHRLGDPLAARVKGAQRCVWLRRCGTPNGCDGTAPFLLAIRGSHCAGVGLSAVGTTPLVTAGRGVLMSGQRYAITLQAILALKLATGVGGYP